MTPTISHLTLRNDDMHAAGDLSAIVEFIHPIGATVGLIALTTFTDAPVLANVMGLPLAIGGLEAWKQESLRELCLSHGVLVVGELRRCALQMLDGRWQLNREGDATLVSLSGKKTTRRIPDALRAELVAEGLVETRTRTSRWYRLTEKGIAEARAAETTAAAG